MKGKARYIRFGAMVVTFSLIGYALYYMASEFMNALEHEPPQKYTLISERTISLYWYPMILLHLRPRVE